MPARTAAFRPPPGSSTSSTDAASSSPQRHVGRHDHHPLDARRRPRPATIVSSAIARTSRSRDGGGQRPGQPRLPVGGRLHGYHDDPSHGRILPHSREDACMTLWLTGDPTADQLLTDDPFALLIGMLLDQQVTRWRRRSPVPPRSPPAWTASTCTASRRPIRRRSPRCAPRRRPCTATPARWPAASRRVAAALVEQTTTATSRACGPTATPTAPTVLKRLKALPGFGDQKARIFLALLGKQRGVQPAGWAEAAGAYGEPGARRSIADVTDPVSMSRGPRHEAGGQGGREGYCWPLAARPSSPASTPRRCPAGTCPRRRAARARAHPGRRRRSPGARARGRRRAAGPPPCP